ncbi:MAG: hypothetical protein ACI3ZQ_10335 [Candidatus Cryptobacteroides sp.]
MCNKTFIWIFVSFCCIACNNSHKATSFENVKKADVTYKIDSNILTVKSLDTLSHSVYISTLEADSTGIIISSNSFGKYSFWGPKEFKIDIDSVVRYCYDENIIELAYRLTDSDTLPVSIEIDGNIHIDYEYCCRPKQRSEGVYAKLVSGRAESLVKEESVVPEIKTIREWLYDHNKFLGESDIQKMHKIYKDLLYKYTNNYIPENASAIPIIKDFSGLKYRINTNVVADYYYLFAATGSKEIEDFIRDVITDNYHGAIKDSHKTFDCYRTNGADGILIISLIGINNNAQRNLQVVPVGVVCLDNNPPRITTEGESETEEERMKSVFGTSSSSRIYDKNDYKKKAELYSKHNSYGSYFAQNIRSDVKTFNSRQFSFNIVGVPEIKTIEKITVRGEDFRGQRAEFTLTYGKNVKSITFSYKGVNQKIDLSKRESPYNFSCYLPLNLGKNYIKIFAEDKLGNSHFVVDESTTNLSFSERLEMMPSSFYVEMVRSQEPETEINVNIDNNVDVNVW